MISNALAVDVSLNKTMIIHKHQQKAQLPTKHL